jgi:hypothetical protein
MTSVPFTSSHVTSIPLTLSGRHSVMTLRSKEASLPMNVPNSTPKAIHRLKPARMPRIAAQYRRIEPFLRLACGSPEEDKSFYYLMNRTSADRGTQEQQHIGFFLKGAGTVPGDFLFPALFAGALDESPRVFACDRILPKRVAHQPQTSTSTGEWHNVRAHRTRFSQSRCRQSICETMKKGGVDDLECGSFEA